MTKSEQGPTRSPRSDFLRSGGGLCCEGGDLFLLFRGPRLYSLISMSHRKTIGSRKALTCGSPLLLGPALSTKLGTV